ncbi:Ribosomal_protein L13 [Hexamita inflata]|uniref:Ribosomal protein L13 n=1 Tax=Hexamita inflata TaxID=28002 RepID=A0AA86NKS5_9EUKA|nr:Ribosomal protein L13 [Hexamita inflata]
MKDTIVIDARDHLLGRLSAVVAKELLNGNKIVITHCEKVNISGSFFRNKTHYLDYFQKRVNYNHKRGPFHFRDPAYIVRKTIRRMVPNKTVRGKQAMLRLQTYSGMPENYQTGHVVIPEAMRELRLKSTRKFAVLGEIAAQIGWKHAEATEVFEKKWAAADAKRRAEYNQAYETACKNPEVAKMTEELKKYGYGF